MMDDGWAYRARERDWWVEGGSRVIQGLLGAVLVGVFLLLANLAFARYELTLAVLKPRQIALIGFALVFCAGLIGAAQFIIQRPFM